MYASLFLVPFYLAACQLGGKSGVFDYKIGLYTVNDKGAVDDSVIPLKVCAHAFREVYCLSDYALRRHKYNVLNATFDGDSGAFVAYNDRSVVSQQQVKRMMKMAKDKTSNSYGLDASDVRDLSTTCLPRKTDVLHLHAWMQDHFQTTGDEAPNGDEIHLEKIEKKLIHDDYKRHCTDLGIDFLSYNYFCRIWKEQFPHVKIREYKSVTGKCHFCAILTELRTKSQKREVRQKVCDLHCLHRYTYMAERKVYYANILKALTAPADNMSIIMDGAAQNQTVVPWMANITNFPNPLKMHLQGVLEHGQEFVSYYVLRIVLRYDLQVSSYGTIPHSRCTPPTTTYPAMVTLASCAFSCSLRAVSSALADYQARSTYRSMVAQRTRISICTRSWNS